MTQTFILACTILAFGVPTTYLTFSCFLVLVYSDSPSSQPQNHGVSYGSLVCFAPALVSLSLRYTLLTVT